MKVIVPKKKDLLEVGGKMLELNSRDPLALGSCGCGGPAGCGGCACSCGCGGNCKCSEPDFGHLWD